MSPVLKPNSHIMGPLLCAIGIHDWDWHMVNVDTQSGTTNMLTIHFCVCRRCAKSRLHWIFNNGHRR